MIAGAQFVHCLDHYCRPVGVRRLVYAVAEVENVPASPAEIGKNLLDFRANRPALGVQCAGVQIALQGDPVAHSFSRFTDIEGPIQA